MIIQNCETTGSNSNIGKLHQGFLCSQLTWHKVWSCFYFTSSRIWMKCYAPSHWRDITSCWHESLLCFWSADLMTIAITNTATTRSDLFRSCPAGSWAASLQSHRFKHRWHHAESCCSPLLAHVCHSLMCLCVQTCEAGSKHQQRD